jgi:hypothetical protein
MICSSVYCLAFIESSSAILLYSEDSKTLCCCLRGKGQGPDNDRRDPNELISALLNYLKANQTLRDKDAKKSLDHLRASQLITNIGSHHQNLYSTSLVRGDIETVIRDVSEFEELLTCPECGTLPSKKYSPQFSELKLCKCGNFKL